MHPCVPNRPTAHGVSVPWIEYRSYESRMRYAPSGLSGPGGTTGRGGFMVLRIDCGTTQVGFSSLVTIQNERIGLGVSSVPMPIGQVRIETSSPSFADSGYRYRRISGRLMTMPR